VDGEVVPGEISFLRASAPALEAPGATCAEGCAVAPGGAESCPRGTRL